MAYEVKYRTPAMRGRRAHHVAHSGTLTGAILAMYSFESLCHTSGLETAGVLIEGALPGLDVGLIVKSEGREIARVFIVHGEAAPAVESSPEADSAQARGVTAGHGRGAHDSV